jgi:hypothetical protein
VKGVTAIAPVQWRDSRSHEQLRRALTKFHARYGLLHQSKSGAFHHANLCNIRVKCLGKRSTIEITANDNIIEFPDMLPALSNEE